MPPYYMPPTDHPALQYMRNAARSSRLGARAPRRPPTQAPRAARPPVRSTVQGFRQARGRHDHGLVRLIKDLMKDKQVGKYFVPIIPDEARTFGLDAIFPSAKIFNTTGQSYTPVDADMMLSYRESEQGRILHTGITEAGSAAAFQVVGTAYATHDLPMVPIYIFYSCLAPAHGRPVLGGRRPAHQGLRHRRDGRPHDARGRGPAAHGRPFSGPGRHQPRVRVLRPGLRLRDPPHHGGRPAAHVR